MQIPRYERQVNAPAKTMQPASNLRMPLADPAAAGMKTVAEAAGGISEQAQKRYEQRQKERRAMGVADAVSQLRQFESERIVPMYGLSGKDAVGDIKDPEKSPSAYEQGIDLYDEEIERIAGGIMDAQVAADFRLKASSVRAGGLESLARHVATEHQVLKQNTYNTTYGNLVQSVSTNWSNSQVLADAIAEINALADETFPGLDMSETKRTAESGLRATVIKRMAETSPQVAENHLKAWRDKMLPETYEQLITPIQSESLFEKVRQEHAGDFDAMDDAAQASAYDQRVKNTVSGWVRAAEAEKNRRDAEALKQRRVDGYNNFWGSMREGNLTRAMKTAGSLNTDDFSQQEIYNLEAYVRQGAVKNNDLLEKSLHVRIRTGDITDMQQLYRMPEMQQLSVEALGRLESLIEKEQKEPSHYGQAMSSLETRFDRVYKDTEYYQLKPLYVSELLDDIEREEEVKGRRLTTQEVLAVGNAMLDLKEQEIPFWFDSSTRDFSERAEQYQEGVAKKNKADQEPTLKSNWIDQIEPVTRNSIIESLKQSGIPATEDNVWSVYQRYHADESRRIMEATPQ